MSICRACKQDHSPLMRCEVFRRQQALVVVHATQSIADPVALVVHTTKHGKYADQEKRKAYRREWMRAKRASAKAGSSQAI